MTEHLTTAADAQHGAPAACALHNDVGKAARPQPREIGGGTLRARENQEIGLEGIHEVFDKAHRDTILVLEWLEIVEIGDPGQPDDSDVEVVARRWSTSRPALECHRILLRDAKV